MKTLGDDFSIWLMTPALAVDLTRGNLAPASNLKGTKAKPTRVFVCAMSFLMSDREARKQRKLVEEKDV